MATTELIEPAIETSNKAQKLFSLPIGAVLVANDGSIYTGVKTLRMLAIP